ncbi:MAG: undecaprenyl-diphosphate phosphatase [Bdellovibrionia bacterium]
MTIIQMILLAMIQGAAELLPVSSSAHVIVAEKLMGLDPSTPKMTFFLVMLHTGTMFAVLLYFWPRWRKLKVDFLKMTLLATAVTGVIGLGLKKFIEKVILGYFMGESHAEIESLFKSLPLIGCSLFSVGILILIAARREKSSLGSAITPTASVRIGVVQGLCLPFRGFSRSGATISTALMSGINRAIAEDFSFALAVLLTPPVVVLELHRLIKSVNPEGAGLAAGLSTLSTVLPELLGPGLLGMVFSFGAGLLALRWLSAWLESGKWRFFGYYCIFFSLVVFTLQGMGF